MIACQGKHNAQTHSSSKLRHHIHLSKIQRDIDKNKLSVLTSVIPEENLQKPRDDLPNQLKIITELFIDGE